MCDLTFLLTIVWYFVVIQVGDTKATIKAAFANCDKIQQAIDEAGKIEFDLVELERLTGRLWIRIYWIFSRDYRELLGKRRKKIYVCLGWINLVAGLADLEISAFASGDDLEKWTRIKAKTLTMQSAAKSANPSIAAIQHGKDGIIEILGQLSGESKEP